MDESSCYLGEGEVDGSSCYLGEGQVDGTSCYLGEGEVDASSCYLGEREVDGSSSYLGGGEVDETSQMLPLRCGQIFLLLETSLQLVHLKHVGVLYEHGRDKTFHSGKRMKLDEKEKQNQ